MAYVLASLFPPGFEDANGNPLVLGTIEFYIWNTSTPTSFYVDQNGTSGGTSCALGLIGQPINGGGTSIQIFLDDAVVYKVIRKDAAGTEIAPTIGPFYPLSEAVGIFSNMELVTSSATLTSSSAGHGIICSAAVPSTLTIPLSSSVPAGATIRIYNVSSGLITLATQGADAIQVLTGVPISPLEIPAGSFVDITGQGGDVWWAAGTAVLYKSSEFSSSLTSNGSQELPGGFIMKWGPLPTMSMTAESATAAFTFNIPFPNNLFAVSMTNNQTVVGANTYSIVGQSVSGGSLFCNSYVSTANANGTYIAIGN